MWLVRLALSRPYTFVVIAILVLILGFLSIFRTPTDIFPSINIPVVSVVWSYTGMPPDDMANRITTIFELSVTTTVNNIEHMESQSLRGVSVIKIFFNKGVDIATALSQVTAIAQTQLKYLPPGITPPFVLSYDASTVAVMNIVLSSDTLPEQALNDLGNNFVRPQLATVQGASVPPGYGGKSRMVEVDLDNKAMQQYGVSAQNVAQALNLQSIIIPAGTEKVGHYEYFIKPNNSPLQVEEFNNLPVKSSSNVVIYLREIAHVRDGFPPQTNIVNINGVRAVMLGVEKTGAASTLDIISRVLDVIPRIKASLTKELQLTISGNQAMFIQSAIQGVVGEGTTAAFLTGSMILLFLGSIRSTLIVTVSIPLAILTSLVVLSALGETINIMTLGGLALVIGILVDDATVAIENISWHLEQGKPLKESILDGAQQIATPAIVATTCICIVFLPMFMLSGISHFLFVPLAKAVIFAMIASYFLSRTLLPTMAYYMLQTREELEKKTVTRFDRFHQSFEGQFKRLQAVYETHLTLALDNQLQFVGLFLGFVVLTLVIIWPALGSDFFPNVDAGQILVHYSAPPGTRIEETAKLAAQVNQVIREVIPTNELAQTVDNIGLPISGVNLTYNNSATNAPNDTDTYIALTPKHHPVRDTVRTLRQRFHDEFPGVDFAFLPADIVSQILNFGIPSVIDIQIAGLDLENNREYSLLLLNRLKQIPGLVDARIRQSNRYPAFNLNVDRTRAKELGFTQQDVGNSLLISLSGDFQTAPNFWVDPTNNMSYQVNAQTPQYNIDTIQELMNTAITNVNVSSSPQILGAVASLERSAIPLVVSHYNVQPVIDIFAGVDGTDLGSVSRAINKILNETRDHVAPGTQVFVRGQIQMQQSTFQTLYFGLAFSILLIYMIIVINFQSWLDPFIIITALPGALAGIAWMLFFTHTHLSVPALTGAIMCMGVATSNSILMVSFARDKLAEGLEVKKAALEAGVTRLRPVLMTACAMIIGMIPMALGLGDGGEQNAPLGRAVIGGLSIATIATLFFVPSVFCIFHGRSIKKGTAHHDSMA